MARSKKDIDKEIMYNKIMPSSLKTTAAHKGGARAPEDLEEPALSPPQEENAPAAAFFKQDGVQLRQTNQTLVINIMEYLVMDKLDAAFEKFKCCKCDKCKKDVAALALNRLQPKYMVVAKDHISDYISKQMSAQVTTAIVQAILIVRASPRH